MRYINKNDQFDISQFLAADLAEDELRNNISEMMITNSSEKSKTIRDLVDSNQDSIDNSAAQEYRTARRSIYGAIWNLIDGYKGYKLVKE